MNYFILNALFLIVFSLDGNNPIIGSHKVETGIKIDGGLDEWENHNDGITIKNIKGEDLAIIKSFWDTDFLYFAFKVQDTNLEAKQTILDHPELYLDDMVEFLLDTENDKNPCWNADDIIYHINLLGQKKDDSGSPNCKTDPSWNGEAKYAIKITGTLNTPNDIDVGYNIEIKIPWTELNLDPHLGLKVGANFGVGDNGELEDWVGASPFRSPQKFGDLVLMD